MTVPFKLNRSRLDFANLPILATIACLFACFGMPQAVLSQSWQTQVTVCNLDGSSVSGGGGRGFYDGAMVSGILTGSGGGSGTPGYLTYSPGPNDWLQQSGSYLYSWMDDNPPRVNAEAFSHLYNPNSDTPVYATGSGHADVNFSLYKFYLWQTWWDDQDTGLPADLASMPTPPASLHFLLQTDLRAISVDGYGTNGWNPVSTADYKGLSAISSVQDMFGESVSAIAPVAPDSLSGGYNYQKAEQTGGGRHLVTVPLQWINGKAIYTVTLTGQGHVKAVNTIGNIGLVGDASASGILNGYAKQDNRAVSISADKDVTNMKVSATNPDGSVKYDAYHNTIFKPVPHIADSDGTMYGDIGIGYGSFNAIPQADDLYAVNYIPHLAGTWGANSTYNWFSSLENSGGSGPTFGNTYIKAQAYASVPPVIFPEDTGKTDHIHLTVVDGNDSAQGTANYYLTLHQSVEFSKSNQANEDVTKEIEEIEVDPPKYATPGLSVNCKWNAPPVYWDYLGGGIGAMAEIPGVDEGLPWFGLFCVSAGIAVDHLKPVADTGGATFDPVQPGSTFPDEVLHPFATTNHALFKMYPHILGLYRRTHLLVDKWGTTGFVSETPIDSDVYVRGAGSFGNYVYSP